MNMSTCYFFSSVREEPGVCWVMFGSRFSDHRSPITDYFSETVGIRPQRDRLQPITIAPKRNSRYSAITAAAANFSQILPVSMKLFPQFYVIGQLNNYRFGVSQVFPYIPPHLTVFLQYHYIKF